MNSDFKTDIEIGLGKKNKSIPSKYFYDKKGDALFVKIMNMPEYYLTNAELDIFKNQTKILISSLDLDPNSYFDLIELGAGDGTKTKYLLKDLLDNGFKFNYKPVDISKNALVVLNKKLKSDLPELKIEAQQGDYFEVLSILKKSNTPKVILFLGSNIGNLMDDKAKLFVNALSDTLNNKDKVVIGVDLIKSKDIVLPAYNDRQGITKRFNLNILERINRELGGNFDLDAFSHAPDYTEEEGVARSFLISKKQQTVYIRDLDKRLSFKSGEKIHTEISRKYNDTILQDILKDSGLSIIDKLTDSNEYFADYILIKSSYASY